MEEYQINALDKIANSKILKSVYPMIDKIDVLFFEPLGAIILRIFLNDSTIDSENLYSKGLDPHYLVDYHFRKLMKIIGISKKIPIGYVVFNSDGKNIDDFLPR